MENNWMKVIEERIKRDGQSKLTNYCVKSHKSIVENYNKEKQIKLRLNGMFEQTTPVVSSINNIHIPKREIEHQLERIPTQSYCVPLTMVLVKKPVDEKCVQTETEKIKPEWPGVQEVMAFYHKYASGKLINLYAIYMFIEFNCRTINGNKNVKETLRETQKGCASEASRDEVS